MSNLGNFVSLEVVLVDYVPIFKWLQFV